MSHYTKLSTKIRSKRQLAKALKKLGYKPEVHDKPVHLNGYGGRRSQEKAEVIIRAEDIEGASADVGFQKQEDGTYKLINDEYEFSGDKLMRKLNVAYSEEVARYIAQQKGFKIQSAKTNKDGSRTLTLTAPVG